MFVYKRGKLYVQHGDKIVGVEIHSDEIVKVEGTEKELGKEFELLTLDEVRLRFGHDYEFKTKRVAKEVNGDGNNESTDNAPKSTKGRRANRS